MASSDTARLAAQRRTTLKGSLRHSSLAAGCLLVGAVTAHAQTYSTVVVAPSQTQVAQFSTTTTASSSTFTRPAVSRPGVTKPTGNSGLGSAVAFAKTGFTPTATGSYTVQLSGVTYGTDSTLGNVSDYLQTIYTEPVTATPAGITNVVQDYNPTVTTGDSYPINLTAGTAYTFVDHGYYNATDFAATPAHGASFGTANTTILFNNPGSTASVPDNSTTGASQTITVTNANAITTFNSITIDGLKHSNIGDLVATLSHTTASGTTIVDLFDHVNANNTPGTPGYNYGQGSQAKFDGNNYTFALSGASLNSVADTATAPDGVTYMASGNAAMGFDAANAGNTLNSFLGQTEAGTWTLTLKDEQPDDLGSFTGFSFTVNNAAPEPSQYAAFGVGLLGLGALALRARRRRQAA